MRKDNEGKKHVLQVKVTTERFLVLLPGHQVLTTAQTLSNLSQGAEL